MNTNQPPAKWTKVTTEDSPVIVYKDDGKLIGEITYIKIPLSLVEQLQSEARMSLFKVLIKNQEDHMLKEIFKKQIEEARADERKKISNRFVLYAIKIGTREQPLSKIHDFVMELEQPVESKEDKR